MGSYCSCRRVAVVDSAVVVLLWTRLVDEYLVAIRHTAIIQRLFTAASPVLRRRPRELLNSATRARQLGLV